VPDTPKPMLAALSDRLPIGAEWSYEVKWDGYRAFIDTRNGTVRLRSRRDADLTRSYPTVAEAAATLHGRDVILDGEIVALDPEGRPSFQALQHRTTPGAFVTAYYAFDILSRDRRSLTARPLVERRRELREVVTGSRILLSEPLPGTPDEIEAMVRRFGLEGVVAKRLDSRYEAGLRTGAWTKVKFAQRQEFVIGGLRADGRSVDALVVGYYKARALLAAGKVRAGLTPRLRRDLFDMLQPFTVARCPFANLPNAKTGRWGEGITEDDMHTLTWVKPRVVCEVTFTEWTAGGSLRHAAFVGLRTDKKPSFIVRE
jgi:bifunctional non-homologous end joining protein LigD